jgi:cell division protein FtsL
VKQRPFLALWTLAVIATVAAFVLHLGLRGRTVDLGYKLGRARAEQARLREQKRVLSLEAASYETPQRVEMVARTLLGMNPPPPERVIPLKPMASLLPPEEGDGQGDVEQPVPRPSASVPASPAGTVPAPVPAPADGPGGPAVSDVAAPPTDVPAVLDPSLGGSP